MSDNKKPQGGGRLPFLNNGVAQVAMVVRDLDRVVEQWWELFGIGPWHFYTYGKPLVKQMSYRGKPVEYSMRVALSWIGPLRIELIEPVGGPTVYDEFLREHGPGVHHFGVLVENMAAAIRQAEESGLAMTMDGSGFGLDGDGHYAYLNTEERIGTTIELIERPKGRQAPEKIYPPETSERPATVQPPSSRGPAPSGGLPGGPTSFGGQLAGGPPPGAPPLDEQPGSPEPSFRNGQGDYQ